MHDLIDFLLYLAFGGFMFLCIIYVLRVVFFLSPREGPSASGNTADGR
jgi:hypothetical protein